MIEPSNFDLGNTPDSVLDYLSALEQQNNELKAQVEHFRIAALNAISFMAGGQAKSDLRDAYDATPAQCLSHRDAEIEALAGRNGFIAACKFAGEGWFSALDQLKADAYANQIKLKSKQD